MEAFSKVARRKRYERQPGADCPHSPIKLALLQFVASFGIASLPQLARLIEHREQATRRHMRDLFDCGYVALAPLSRAVLGEAARPGDPSLLFGSAPNCYTVTRKGVGTLQAAGLFEESRTVVLRSYGPGSSRFIAHALMVADAHVWLYRTARHLNHHLKIWREAGAAEIAVPMLGKPKIVRPDAWFVYALSGAVLVGLVEADRATERGERRWKEKLANYAALFASNALKAATGFSNARVLVITPSDRRAQQLHQIISKQAPSDLAARFWMACESALEDISFAKALWRQAGKPDLQPLLSQSVVKP